MSITNTNTPVHINLNIRGMGTSATVAINERCDELQKQGKHVHRLGFGQSPFPVPDPIVKALQLHAEKKKYLPVAGLPELQRAVAQYHQRTQQIEIEEQHVLIGPGSKELMFLLQLAYYGNVIVPTPAWVSYIPQAKIIGKQIHTLPTKHKNNYLLDAETLEEFCKNDPKRPRIVILNYPSNPTGKTYNETQLKDLAQVARAHNLLILSDEIYGQLHYEGAHLSIAKYYPEGTIISSGLSKWCGAGGWRLGTFLFPPNLYWLFDAMAATASETFTSTSTPIQYAAITAYTPNDFIDRYLMNARRILQAIGTWTAKQFQNTGAHCLSPNAAFYVFPDFTSLDNVLKKRNITTSQEFCDQLFKDTHVAVLPGSYFGQDPSEISVRLAFVDFDGKKALEALPEGPVEESFLRQYCNQTLQGVESFCDWINH